MDQISAVASSLKPALLEARECRCPYCKDDGVTPVGLVICEAGMIKVKYRCAACETAFLHARKALN